MIKQEPVMNLRKNLGELLNGVEYKHDTVIVTRGGRASAVIIDMQLFEKIKKMRQRFEQLTSNLQKSFEDSNKSLNEIDALIDEAVKAARNK